MNLHNCTLNYHDIRNVHLKLRHIMCTRCPRRFQSHSHFKHHINSDHGGVYMKPEMLKFKDIGPEDVLNPDVEKGAINFDFFKQAF